MGSFPWGVALAVFGVVVPAIAFLYEFVFVGRKRLGYRVQVDTTATGEVPSQYAGALQQLQQNGTRLIDPSFVLLRIENNGATHIDTSDYAVLDDDKDSTAGSREPFKAPEIVGGIKCPLDCATGELTLTGSCTTGCKRCPHISRHNAPAPNPTDNEREQLPVLGCRRRGVYDAFMPSLMLHFVVCRVFGSLQPLMVNALMRLLGCPVPPAAGCSTKRLQH